jgi:HK97 family phage major capsid protein
MARRQINLPVLDQTGTTAGVPHWFGGMRFYWAEEASAKTETDANFRQVSLVAHKLIGYTRASDELVDDSAISLDAFLSGPLALRSGWKITLPGALVNLRHQRGATISVFSSCSFVT